MTIAQALATFISKSMQCDSLVSNAHRPDSAGVPLFPKTDCDQITIAAFLNLFIAWEEFLETTISQFMVGSPTLSGVLPVRYALPPNTDAAKKMLIGTNRYFDYANHDFFRRMVALYFQNGYPFEPHLSAIASELSDLKTMRNSSAHISSTTQIALEGLALRIFGAPRPGITLYDMLTAVHPGSATGNTVLAESRDTLLASAQLIAQG